MITKCGYLFGYYIGRRGDYSETKSGTTFKRPMALASKNKLQVVAHVSLSQLSKIRLPSSIQVELIIKYYY